MIQLDEPALHLLRKQGGKPNPTVIIPTAGNKANPRKNALSSDFVVPGLSRPRIIPLPVVPLNVRAHLKFLIRQ